MHRHGTAVERLRTLVVPAVPSRSLKRRPANQLHRRAASKVAGAGTLTTGHEKKLGGAPRRGRRPAPSDRSADAGKPPLIGGFQVSAAGLESALTFRTRSKARRPLNRSRRARGPLFGYFDAAASPPPSSSSWRGLEAEIHTGRAPGSSHHEAGPATVRGSRRLREPIRRPGQSAAARRPPVPRCPPPPSFHHFVEVRSSIRWSAAPRPKRMPVPSRPGDVDEDRSGPS